MRLLVINGSPRRGGNTDLLVAEFVKGAQSVGAETKVIVLSDLNISPCQHCDACLAKGVCRIQDDMQMVYSELEKADRIVLASPIHFMGLTAQMKGMIDRCQALWARKYRLKVPPLDFARDKPLGDIRERKGFFISVGGRRIDSARLFEPALAVVESVFTVMNVKLTGSLLFPGVDESGGITRVSGALEKAFKAGRDFVS